ncbi:prenyltransferase/squalene oxidase repeat-containing protein [Micromonospora sp. WMMD558]|uniref:prenyltransferase/squalene oxidase repeat-containing protein n=1 Tax=unclassified Micromonospora TaxID=2617518 RepID=UPI0012B4B3D8|nr:prenyltransferase/squalene oxidase repeat-containing protein [Micromonospora sp. WMMC415]QGN47864.1 prenyltransferase [Micromonospora sp. WMMC415]
MSDGQPQTVIPPASALAADPGCGSDECGSQARALVAAMALRPWGQVAPSVYETGRLVALAPWLDRHDERIAFLLGRQRADGAWGPPEGYAVVPTLSATDALLAVLPDAGSPAGRRPAVEAAVGRALAALPALLATAPPEPGTPAFDLVVPALVESINRRLAGPGVPAAAPRSVRLPSPGADARLTAVRAAYAAGADLPPKLAHFGEVLAGPVGRSAPAGPAVGASPAATVAWLNVCGAGEGAEARRFLDELVGESRGPVPCPSPITVFERAWTLSTLVRAGVDVRPSPALVASLAGAVGVDGAATGAGLLADADTTSVTLYALGRLGHAPDPASLWRYETADGFCTWPGEDGFSVTTNAHVLDSFADHLRREPHADRYRAAVRRLVRVLLDRQDADGAWRDRWHASAYYATACCVLALAASGCAESAAALRAAARWALARQRDDGSWGRWEGTPEETAYALQIILALPGDDPAVVVAALRGHSYLQRNRNRRDHPPLWYGKELYCPTTIVRATVTAGTHVVHSRLTRERAAAGSDFGPES